MTPQQIKLVQVSFAKVAPIADTAADLFYSRLFEIAPEIRPMFPNDLAEQKKKLMSMLGTVVAGLSRLDMMIPAIQMLGRRHAEYGVTAAHYAPVGAALIWTLEQGLGEEFTDNVRDAWVAAFTTLATTMVTASGDVPFAAMAAA
jgi:hemoglobin-like flavoprotein